AGRSSVVAQHYTWGDKRTSGKPIMRGKRDIWLPLKRRYSPVPVYDRYSLKPGSRLAGPVVLEERESTLVVPVPAAVRILPDYSISVNIKEFQGSARDERPPATRSRWRFNGSGLSASSTRLRPRLYGLLFQCSCERLMILRWC